MTNISKIKNQPFLQSGLILYYRAFIMYYWFHFKRDDWVMALYLQHKSFSIKKEFSYTFFYGLKFSFDHRFCRVYYWSSHIPLTELIYFTELYIDPNYNICCDNYTTAMTRPIIPASSHETCDHCIER